MINAPLRIGGDFTECGDELGHSIVEQDLADGGGRAGGVADDRFGRNGGQPSEPDRLGRSDVIVSGDS